MSLSPSPDLRAYEDVPTRMTSTLAVAPAAFAIWMMSAVVAVPAMPAGGGCTIRNPPPGNSVLVVAAVFRIGTLAASPNSVRFVVLALAEKMRSEEHTSELHSLLHL